MAAPVTFTKNGNNLILCVFLICPPTYQQSCIVIFWSTYHHTASLHSVTVVNAYQRGEPMLNLLKRKIGIDDLADVRYLHGSSFRMCGASHHTSEEIESYLTRINSIDYTNECLNCNLHGLWHEGALIGTSGWSPSTDNRNTARIRKIYVHSYFVGLGLGRMMMETAENLAGSAGFESFSIRTNASAADFFSSLGYRVSSHGLLATPRGPNIPVTYMRKPRTFTAQILGAKYTERQTELHH